MRSIAAKTKKKDLGYEVLPDSKGRKSKVEENFVNIGRFLNTFS